MNVWVRLASRFYRLVVICTGRQVLVVGSCTRTGSERVAGRFHDRFLWFNLSSLIARVFLLTGLLVWFDVSIGCEACVPSFDLGGATIKTTLNCWSVKSWSLSRVYLIRIPVFTLWRLVGLYQVPVPQCPASFC